MPEEGTPEEGGTFTPPASQEEFDRMIGARLVREREKFAGYDELKTKAAKFDELDAQSKTELQKLQDAIAERDTKLADLPKTARKEAIRFASAASKAGFLDPEDALMNVDVDLSDDAAVKEALEALAERKPHLVRAPDKGKRLPSRPKPAGGESSDDDDPAAGLKGKERAAAALRQFRNT